MMIRRVYIREVIEVKGVRLLISGTAFVLLTLSTGCAASHAHTSVQNTITQASTDSSQHQADQGASSESGLSSALRARIQTYYAKQKTHIVSSQYFSPDHGLLVQSQVDSQTVASRYDWWDTQTGGHFSVPTGSDYVKLLHASALKVRLEATGRNNIDSFVAFPSIIDDTRGNDAAPFQMNARPYYLKLAHAVQFGDHHRALMTELYLTADGFQAVFSWLPGKKTLFYAGSAGCPTMDTDYNPQTRVFTIRLQNTTFSAAARRAVVTLTNGFIASAAINSIDGNAVIQLRLRSKAAYFNAKQSHIYDQARLPYVVFHFAGQGPQSYPVVLEK